MDLRVLGRVLFPQSPIGNRRVAGEKVAEGSRVVRLAGSGRKRDRSDPVVGALAS